MAASSHLNQEPKGRIYQVMQDTASLSTAWWVSHARRSESTDLDDLHDLMMVEAFEDIDYITQRTMCMSNRMDKAQVYRKPTSAFLYTTRYIPLLASVSISASI